MSSPLKIIFPKIGSGRAFFWPGTGFLVHCSDCPLKMCDNCNFSPWNHKMRSVDTCKFQSHSIFENYCIAACFLIIYITFIARRCSRGAWLGIIAFPQILLPEIARQDLLTHVSFNPIRFSKIIVSLHVFWEFPLLEIARQDLVWSAVNCKFQSDVIFEGGNLKVLDLALQC